MILKRCFDLISSALGLIILSPLFLLISLLIKLDSRGAVFFRQERIGQFGRIFWIHKFRTMVSDAESKGLQITVGADVRITDVGHVLRKYKLDELPQLIDVFFGSMSLVGPRPEVPRYVACYPENVKKVVLSVRPGITEWASIKYKEENQILGAAENPQRAYIEQVLPIKLKYYVDYVRGRTFFGDLKIIVATLVAIVR